MPSVNQTGAKTKSGEYDSDAKKMLATKNDLTIAALIRGIRKPERVDAYVQAEVELAEEEDRDVRKDIIGACNRKKTALTGGGIDTPEDTDVGEDGDTDTHDPDSADDSDEADPEPEGEDDVDDEDDGEPFPDVPRFDTVEALEEAVEDHEHGDAFTTAKPAGTLAGCFKCEAHIGFVPRDG